MKSFIHCYGCIGRMNNVGYPTFMKKVGKERKRKKSFTRIGNNTRGTANVQNVCKGERVSSLGDDYYLVKYLHDWTRL